MHPHLFLPAASLCPAVPICFAYLKKEGHRLVIELYCGRGFFAENAMELMMKLIMLLFNMLAYRRNGLNNLHLHSSGGFTMLAR